MKPHLDISHNGSLGTEDRTRMSFDENSLAHLMSVLTDLYSDPELAVIREYSINALDSHQAAKNIDPILVTLPNSMKPVFEVADHGTGMSLDQITTQFTKYGFSSKRETDSQVGMLGLGCKSALTYTSQFTLVSYSDGLKITVLVTRDDDGAGMVQIVDTSATDQPNGVTVQVPVRQVSSFNQKAAEFFYYWEDGTVLVNGRAPGEEARTDDHPADRLGQGLEIQLAPNLWIRKSGHYDEHSRVVMGNVAYPVELNLTRLTCIARVPIGSVDFTPSRETLQMTKRTKACLASLQELVDSRIAEQPQEEINACGTASEALKVANKWDCLLRNARTYHWNGAEVPTGHIYVPKDQNVRMLTSGSSSKITIFDTCYSKNFVNLTGYTAVTVSSRTVEKIKSHLAAKGLSGNSVIISEEPFGKPWLDLPEISWDEVRQIKLAPVERVHEYQYVLAGRIRVSTSLPRGRKLLWTPSVQKSGNRWNDSALFDLSQAVGRGIAVIIVPKNKLGYMKKHHPEIRPLSAWVSAKLATNYLGLDIPTYAQNRLAVFGGNPDGIDDKWLANLVSEIDALTYRAIFAKRLFPIAQHLGMVVQGQACKSIGIEVGRLYPLLSILTENPRLDNLEYVNALYAYRQQRSKPVDTVLEPD